MGRTADTDRRTVSIRRQWRGLLLALCLLWSLPGHALIMMCASAPMPFESPIVGYEDCLILDSLQLGAGRSISTFLGAGRETSNPSFSDLFISTTLQPGLTDLYLGTASGLNLGTVSLDILETACAGGSVLPILQIKLAETILSRYDESSGGERPAESLSLNFTSICMRYNRCENNSAVQGEFKGWDLQTNEVSACGF